MTVDMQPLHSVDHYLAEHTAQPQSDLARGVVAGLALVVLLFWLPLLILVGLL